MLTTANFSGTSFTTRDLFTIFEEIYLNSQVDELSNDEFLGTVTIDGQTNDYEVAGSGFSFAADGNGIYTSTGTMETLSTFRLNKANQLEELLIEGLDIDAAALVGIRVAELDNSNLFGIENMLMGLDWKIKFGNQNDKMGDGILVGDGVALNFRGDDVFVGAGGRDALFGGDGKDTLKGGSGRDELNGGNGADGLFGGVDNDEVFGNKGSDNLNGEKGADILSGGRGNDLLKGGRGNDEMTGGDNDDVMIGGRGADVFVFATGHDENIVKDFDVATTGEYIDLRDVRAIKDFMDLFDNYLSDANGDAVIDDGNGLVIVLEGIEVVDLTFDDFLI